MRGAVAFVIACIFILPAGSIAHEMPPALVAAQSSSAAEPADPELCEEDEITDLCVAAISAGAVVGVIAVNAISGGVLTPILLYGRGASLSFFGGLALVHLVEFAIIGSGAAAAADLTNIVDGAANDPYGTAEKYVRKASDSVSTTIGNWLDGL